MSLKEAVHVLNFMHVLHIEPFPAHGQLFTSGIELLTIAYGYNYKKRTGGGATRANGAAGGFGTCPLDTVLGAKYGSHVAWNSCIVIRTCVPLCIQRDTSFFFDDKSAITSQNTRCTVNYLLDHLFHNSSLQVVRGSLREGPRMTDETGQRIGFL